MTLLILGLLLWTAAHFFKRVVPTGRAFMQDKMGDASKGVIALALVLSVVLMVMAAFSDFTDSLAKLASHMPSRPMVCSTCSAKALTCGASSSLNRPASSASSASRPRLAELQWKKKVSAVEGQAEARAKVAAQRSHWR